MAGEFDFDSASNFLGDAEAVVIDYESALTAKPIIAPPNEWWKGWVRERAGGRQVHRFFYPLHGFDLRDWRGSTELETLGHRFTSVRRRKLSVGVKAEIDKIAEMDFDAFSQSPGSIAKAVGKLPGKKFGRYISYGHLIDDWTGTRFFRTNAGTLKPVHPGKPKYGTWFNAYESSALNSTNVDRAITRLNQVRGFDNESLEFEGTHLWLPTALWREGTLLMNKLQLVPGTDGVSSGGGNTSRVYGALIPHHVPNMRADMWIVAQQPPDETMAPFGRVLGSGSGTPEPVAEPARSGSGMPHIEVITFTANDELYKVHGMLGVAEIVREGWGLLDAHCLVANWTGLSTATVNGVNYGVLPTKL